MAGVNKVILIGHLGRDPEVRSFPNGGKVVTLNLATSEHWRDKQTGDKRERTEWHKVVIHEEHAARAAEQYLKKGSLCYVEGQLETRQWEKNGEKRFATEVVLRPYRGHLTLLEKREDGQTDGGGEARGRYESSGAASGAGYNGTEGVTRQIVDDEIPF